MDPINYSAGVQSPLQAFQGALVTGSEIRQQQALAAQAQLKQQEAEAEAKRQAGIDAAFEKLRQPGATAKDYMDLAMVLPKDQSEALRESFKLMKSEERQSALNDSSQVFSAFKSGRPDVAVSLIRKQAEAERASGNEQGAALAEEWAKMAESGTDGADAVANMFGYTISQMPGGDKAIEGALKFEADRRLADQQPILMAQKQAELDKAKSEAEKSAIEAKYAEKVKIADLEKSAADLGLTKEQTNKVIAETKKLGAETARILMETASLEKTGGIDPEKKFEQEEKLRKEYNTRVQTFTDMKQTYSNIKASAVDGSGAGDIALVTGFMKMLDPGSVVRETEFATARDTSGLLSKLQSMAKKVENGQFLTPQQRKDFSDLAGQYMKAADEHENRVRKDLGSVVQSYGLSADNVFGTSVQPTDITALRSFLAKNNPGSEAKINGMSEEQLKASFPKGYETYRGQTGSMPASVEVDY